MKVKKRFAILGANGYISRNLKFVLERDYPDCEISLYGIESKSADNCSNYFAVDMTDREAIKMIDLSVDVIFMLVGKTGTANGFDEYNSFIDTNEKALLNLLSEYRCQKSNARIVFPSTRLVYRGARGKQKEDADKEFKTVYAINKFACEAYLEQYNRVFDVQYTILRICIPYGTLVKDASSYGTAEFMLSRATNRENIVLYGDGTARRTLTYMEDLCRVMIEASLAKGCANDVFNVGGEDYSLKEMAGLIAQKYGVSVEYKTWPDIAQKIESGDTVFDSEKLDSIVGCKRLMKFADWIGGDKLK